MYVITNTGSSSVSFGDITIPPRSTRSVPDASMARQSLKTIAHLNAQANGPAKILTINYVRDNVETNPISLLPSEATPFGSSLIQALDADVANALLGGGGGGDGFRGYWNPEDAYSAGDIVLHEVAIDDFSVDAIFFAPENVPAGQDNPNSERGSMYWVRLWPQTAGPGGGSTGYRGFWDPDNEYASGEYVTWEVEIGVDEYQEAIFMCTQATGPTPTTPENAPNQWAKIWPQGSGDGNTTFFGPYDGGVSYKAGSIVTNNLDMLGTQATTYWLAVKDNPGNAPNDAQDGTDWVQIGKDESFYSGHLVAMYTDRADPEQYVMYRAGQLIVVLETPFSYAKLEVWLCLSTTDGRPEYGGPNTGQWACLKRHGQTPNPIVAFDVNTPTPVINLFNGTEGTFYITMRTSGTLAVNGPAPAGFLTQFECLIQQDATGGHTLTLPASFNPIGTGNLTAIPTEPLARAILKAKTYDGTYWMYTLDAA